MEHLVINAMSSSNSPLGLRDLCEREGRKTEVTDDAKKAESFRYNRPDSHMNSQRL